ncbi:TPA: hypothetical protein ACH3X2_004255 [Trebouxia sp. C0005]
MCYKDINITFRAHLGHSKYPECRPYWLVPCQVNDAVQSRQSAPFKNAWRAFESVPGNLSACSHELMQKECMRKRTPSPTITASRREPKHPSQQQLLRSQTRLRSCKDF